MWGAHNFMNEFGEFYYEEKTKSIFRLDKGRGFGSKFILTRVVEYPSDGTYRWWFSSNPMPVTKRQLMGVAFKKLSELEVSKLLLTGDITCKDLKNK